MTANTTHLAAVAIAEAAVVLSAPGHRGPAVGSGQLSPTRVAQAMLQQVCCEAYLQVLHAETNSTQMRGYLQHRLNLFYKY